MRVLGVIIIMLLSSAAVYANERLLDNTLDMTSIGRIRLMNDINVVCVVDSFAKNIIEFPLKDAKNTFFRFTEKRIESLCEISNVLLFIKIFVIDWVILQSLNSCV